MAKGYIGFARLYIIKKYKEKFVVRAKTNLQFKRQGSNILQVD